MSGSDLVAPRTPRLVAIYRQSNAGTLLTLVREAVDLGWPVALWALDQRAAVLDRWTVGDGRGKKFPLLNALADASPGEGALIVCDDDVVLTRGSLAEFHDLMTRARFGIAQPAHARNSHASHPITRAVTGGRARWTSFVEIGPIFAVASSWLPHAVPFPEDFGMGWGIELLWYDLQEQGCRLGIVDAVHMQHLHPPAVTYDAHEESVRMLEMVRRRGGRALGDLQRVHRRWWRWQPGPSWTR